MLSGGHYGVTLTVPRAAIELASGLLSFERGEQGGGAVADVVMGALLGRRGAGTHSSTSPRGGLLALRAICSLTTDASTTRGGRCRRCQGRRSRTRTLRMCSCGRDVDGWRRRCHGGSGPASTAGFLGELGGLSANGDSFEAGAGCAGAVLLTLGEAVPSRGPRYGGPGASPRSDVLCRRAGCC